MDDEMNALKEMFSFISANPRISYYDMAAISYREGKENWIRLFKNRKTRTIISGHIKYVKRINKIKYRRSLEDSILDYSNAQKEYLKNKIDDTCESKL